jgi:acyl CoA:acetate/3-ketoacid CoA transferase
LIMCRPGWVQNSSAPGMIPDGAALTIGGFTSIGRASIFYRAIRDAFERCGHPCNLTVIGACPQGGRGKVPGIDIQKDIIGDGGVHFVIPNHAVSKVSSEVVSGKG